MPNTDLITILYQVGVMYSVLFLYLTLHYLKQKSSHICVISCFNSQFSSQRSIALFCKKTISLKFSFSNLETTFSVQNIIVSPIITSHPIVKTHNTPTSISTGKIAVGKVGTHRSIGSNKAHLECYVTHIARDSCAKLAVKGTMVVFNVCHRTISDIPHWLFCIWQHVLNGKQ